jgi:hypothetical protein
MPSFSDKLQLNLFPWLAAGIIRFIYLVVKPESLGKKALQEVWASGQKVILCTWHDQLLLMPPEYTGEGAKVLISASRDGELIARTISYFSLGSVRGSSSRGGRAAFRELLELAREPLDLGITPDGPRGPRHEAKIGVAQLAKVTDRPIVPLAFACSHGHRFKSWDRFLLPYPWGKAVYRFGSPLYYCKDETIEDFQSRVQRAMDDNTRNAGEYLSQHGLSAV